MIAKTAIEAASRPKPGRRVSMCTYPMGLPGAKSATTAFCVGAMINASNAPPEETAQMGHVVDTRQRDSQDEIDADDEQDGHHGLPSHLTKDVAVQQQVRAECADDAENSAAGACPDGRAVVDAYVGPVAEQVPQHTGHEVDRRKGYAAENPFDHAPEDEQAEGIGQEVEETDVKKHRRYEPPPIATGDQRTVLCAEINQVIRVL